MKYNADFVKDAELLTGIVDFLMKNVELLLFVYRIMVSIRAIALKMTLYIHSHRPPLLVIWLI